MNMSFFADSLNVEVKSGALFNIGPFTVTNSMLLGIIGLIVLVAWLGHTAHQVRKKNITPDNTKELGFFSRLAVWCFSTLYKTCREIIPNPKICKIITPFAISLFFYIGIEYYIELLPFVGEVITINGTPLFRGPVADLTFTFALAILAIVLIQIVATIKHGLAGNLHRYFRNPFKSPIGFFEGLLELISEFSRLLSLSIRLFGNVLAGEILILIASMLANILTPPLLVVVYFFEMFIGGIQAYVFFSLTVVFASLATETPEEEDAAKAKTAALTAPTEPIKTIN